jgi:ParB family transcriptional regulator, chromosome partitioning protein
MSQEKPRRLGRGLQALLGPSAVEATDSRDADTASGYLELDVSLIRPNRFQPRREFAPEELAELASSLQSSGMLQPVLVRRASHGFELISGERRFRAALQLGWRQIPAVVREADDRMMLTLALIENLQRADLSVVEEARGFQRLQEEFELTQHQIADAVGKDRSTVANLLRLLALPGSVLTLLERGDLTMGHARALLGVSDEEALTLLAAEIVSQQLSVRDVERRVRAKRDDTKRDTDRKRPASASVQAPAKPAAIQQMESSLRRRFQTDVRIRLADAETGTVELTFYSAADLQRLLELMVGPPSVGD